MLAALFKQDDVLYRIIPVSSVLELQLVKDELATYEEVRGLREHSIYTLTVTGRLS